jgi:hypothetical protein
VEKRVELEDGALFGESSAEIRMGFQPSDKEEPPETTPLPETRDEKRPPVSGPAKELLDSLTGRILKSRNRLDAVKAAMEKGELKEYEADKALNEANKDLRAEYKRSLSIIKAEGFISDYQTNNRWSLPRLEAFYGETRSKILDSLDIAASSQEEKAPVASEEKKAPVASEEKKAPVASEDLEKLVSEFETLAFKYVAVKGGGDKGVNCFRELCRKTCTYVNPKTKKIEPVPSYAEVPHTQFPKLREAIFRDLELDPNAPDQTLLDMETQNDAKN